MNQEDKKKYSEYQKESKDLYKFWQKNSKGYRNASFVILIIAIIVFIYLILK